MRKEDCFALNRWLLLIFIASSIIIPMICLPLMRTPVHMEMIPEFSSNNIYFENLPFADHSNSILGSSFNGQTGNELTIPLETILKYIYLMGLLITIAFLIRNIISVLMLFRNSTITKMDGYRLVISDRNVPSFAFARSIIISRSDYETYGSSILPHERAHIRLNHFYDLIFLELVKVFHWFNPAIYGIIRSLKETHEFQADSYTLHSGVNMSQYQLLIIKKCVGPEKFALANNFNHCQIKKRITMMNKKKNNKAWRWKMAIFLPMIAFLLMAFGKKSENVPESYTVNEMVNERIHVVSAISQAQQTLTDQIIQIKSDGNYIDNKMCSLEEIALQDQEWRNASNKWILLLIDESIPYNRIDEVREALNGSYWVVQSTVGSDDMVFFAGDVSQMAKFKQGELSDWMQSQLINDVPDITSRAHDDFTISFSFIVDKNGKVRDAHIIRECDDPEINAAMEKILAQIPDWDPAWRGSERVSVYYKYKY